MVNRWKIKLCITKLSELSIHDAKKIIRNVQDGICGMDINPIAVIDVKIGKLKFPIDVTNSYFGPILKRNNNVKNTEITDVVSIRMEGFSPILIWLTSVIPIANKRLEFCSS